MFQMFDNMFFFINEKSSKMLEFLIICHVFIIFGLIDNNIHAYELKYFSKVL